MCKLSQQKFGGGIKLYAKGDPSSVLKERGKQGNIYGVSFYQMPNSY